MALVKAQLDSALVVALSSRPASPNEAASRLAAAYADYALSAMAGATLPAFTGAEKTALTSQLFSALSVATGSPARLATAWSSGISAFWLTPPVIFAGVGQTGAVTGFLGQAALQSAIQSALAGTTSSIPQTAALLANALDSATKTVQVAIAPPPGTVVMLL